MIEPFEPLTDVVVKAMRAKHAQFCRDRLTGSWTLEIHYFAGTAKVVRVLGPDLEFRLAAMSS